MLYKGEKWIYKKADALIFTVEGGPKYLRDKEWDKESGGSIDLKRVFYINNGIDLPLVTIGHDSILNSFITIYPSVNVSGNVKIDDFCELGTGSKIIQNKKMTDKVIMGAGAVVIKDILISGTYVGTPAVKIK